MVAVNENAVADLGKEVRDWLDGFDRDAPLVAVPVFNAYEDVLECVTSLLLSTSPGVPILVIDDASTDDRISQALIPLAAARGLKYARNPANLGFVHTVNQAFDWSRPRDVVVVNSDVVLPDGWLERLRAAAYSSSTTATATPLTNNGTLVSVPYRNRPNAHLVDGMTVDQVDSRIQAASRRLRPLIPTAIGHCTYFRRLALEATGYFDKAFAPGYGEEVDLSLRAANLGFAHVAADDLFVYHKGSRSFGDQGEQARLDLQKSHEQLIDVRYPWYHDWVVQTEADAQSPLAFAIETARAALLGYRVAIDATNVGGAPTGTQRHTMELIRAMAAAPTRAARLSVIVGDAVPAAALRSIEQVVDEVVRISDLDSLEAPFDLVYRPCQIYWPEELSLLYTAGRRFLVSSLDCISLSSPAYAKNYDEWKRFLQLTRLVFATADGITFPSHSAAQEAVQHGLVIPAERSCVTYIGVNHELHSTESVIPDRWAEFSRVPFILMLGTNFRHKNRAYALRLLEALIARHGWPGKLVLAGPGVGWGGSQAEETSLLKNHPELRARVEHLGAVDEAQKEWLLRHAALVLYPSVREGFGLVPFEAAALDTPALTSSLASLPEVLGDEVVCLDGFDPEAGADLVWSFLADPERGRRQVAAIKARAEILTWQAVADRTWRFFEQILAMPPRSHPAPRLVSKMVVSSESEDEAEPKAPTTSWFERVKRGIRILRTEGWGALVQEIRQFVRWLRMRR
jgi:GT2 family glycosyltransferase/glycosyltransferase involved in cell wall biosynthesis